MTPLEQLKLIKDERYESEEGRDYGIILKEGLSEDEIDRLAAKLPGSQIPPAIRELLRFTTGFSFLGPDEVNFDDIGQFGFENIFPAAIRLARDAGGNCWIVDVNPEGEWGHVFFVCHDPAVVVKQSEDLTEFIQQLDELGKNREQSTLSVFLDRTALRIHRQDDGFMDIASARSSADPVLREFAAMLPDHFVVADLRDTPIQTGFAWGKYGPDIDDAVRHEQELLWGFGTKNRKKKDARMWWKLWSKKDV
jgi:cell wall assembly regulator SMI1